MGKLYDVDAERLLDHTARLHKLFDLEKQGDWPIRSYSNGQQKKPALCSALVTDAQLMLLDEPFAGGLDPSLANTNRPGLRSAGRLATGRRIIPSYGRLFLPSLLAAFGAMVGEALAGALSAPLATGQPVVVSVWLFLLLGTGPSFRNWELTAENRVYFAEGTGKSGPFVQV